MNTPALWLWPTLWGLLLWLGGSFDALAGDGIETAGDILQLALPTAAAGLTLGYSDFEGRWNLASRPGSH
jgi:hypothetical protein